MGHGRTTAYQPSRFSDLADTDLGKALWEFLNRRDNLVRLETASELGRPAVEAVATRLIDEFGDQVRVDRVKQMIGHMTRQVLESRGFQLASQGVRVRRGDLFSTGSRYKESA